MDLKDLPVAFFFFFLNWEKLTSDSFIQNLVQGYQNLLLKPAQNYVPCLDGSNEPGASFANRSRDSENAQKTGNQKRPADP